MHKSPMSLPKTRAAIQEAWQALLADKSFLPNGGTLGYPVAISTIQDARFQSHQSLIDQQSSTMLKGRDHLVAATAAAAGLKVSFQPVHVRELCR